MKKFVGLLCLLLAVFSWVGVGLALDALEVRTLRQQAKLSFQPLEEGKVLVSVQDKSGDAILGLQKEDFSIKQGLKTAKIISVEDVQEQRNIGLNIVLVVDNSYSMEQRKAVEPLLAAMDSFLTLVRPIDTVHVVTFVDPGTSLPRVSTRTFQANEVPALSQFLRSSFFPATTDGTYLYDSMHKGLEIIRQMPADSQKFMLVFSDGEDINSTLKSDQVSVAAKGVSNFSAYAVDYMDKPGLDPFLTAFAQGHNGMIRKAASANDFLPILKRFSTTIFHRYLVTYRFLAPPAGTLVSAPAAVNIEEVTVVDSSPMLNHVYFDTGKSRIPERYVALAPAETATFSEEKLKDTMEKHHQVLNVIGKRLQANPDARITLVGCNSNSGVEKGKIGLAKNRAEAVFAYFESVWGIDLSRMEIKARNLPAVPSTSRVPEGVVENQRVEILSDHPAILDTIKSTYVQEQADAKELRFAPTLQGETEIERWQLRLLAADDKVLATREGSGAPPAEVVFALEALGLRNLAQLGQVSADLEVKDKEGNVFSTASAPIGINYVRREERIAQKIGNKVVEKYGLILFDFDRADLKDRNQIIVNRVLARVAELKGVAMDIAGHTDIIGKEKYNIELSGRRAKAVYDSTVQSGIAAEAQITHAGNGPNNPPYDNSLPEGRSLNRTVIINLQYTE